jgi:hypothetical protein
MHLCKADGTSFLNETFPDQKFLHMRTSGDESISCFVHWVANPEILRDLWSKITSLIAVEYQSNLISSFSSWNIYLVFVCASSVERSLKYQIENDRFAMRKIVLDGKILTEDEIQNFMNNEIFCLNLDLVSKKIETLDQEAYSEFRKYVSNLGEIPLTQNEAAAKIRIEQLQKIMQWSKNED